MDLGIKLKKYFTRKSYCCHQFDCDTFQHYRASYYAYSEISPSFIFFLTIQNGFTETPRLNIMLPIFFSSFSLLLPNPKHLPLLGDMNLQSIIPTLLKSTQYQWSPPLFFKFNLAKWFLTSSGLLLLERHLIYTLVVWRFMKNDLYGEFIFLDISNFYGALKFQSGHEIIPLLIWKHAVILIHVLNLLLHQS